MFLSTHSKLAGYLAGAMMASFLSLLVICCAAPTTQAQIKKQRTSQKSQRVSRKTYGPSEKVNRRARILNRATALAILKENETALRPHVPGYTSWSLPLSGPSLTTPLQETEGGRAVESIKMEQALLDRNLEFYAALIKAGVLTNPTWSFIGQPDDKGYSPTTYVFGLVRGPGIEELVMNNQQTNAVFTLTQSSFTQVARIHQESGASTATVMVTVTRHPTPLFWRLQKVVAEFSANKTLSNYSRNNPVWATFPDVGDLSKTETQQKTFIRFDDGWRCCR